MCPSATEGKGDPSQQGAPRSGTGWDFEHPPNAEITPEPFQLPPPCCSGVKQPAWSVATSLPAPPSWGTKSTADGNCKGPPPFESWASSPDSQVQNTYEHSRMYGDRCSANSYLYRNMQVTNDFVSKRKGYMQKYHSIKQAWIKKTKTM